MTRTTDTTRNYTFTQTDGASNSTAINGSWIRDIVPPNALTVDTPVEGANLLASATFIGGCETGLNINFAGAGILSPFSALCSGASYTQTVFFSAGDGAKVITASQTDAAGNAKTITRNLVRDETAPSITQTVASSPIYSNTNTTTFGGACETGLTVTTKLGGVTDGSTYVCSGSAWTHTTASQTTDATRTYTFSLADAAGNTNSVTSQWIRDTAVPGLLFDNATTSKGFVSATSTVTFTGTCESGFNVAVSGTETATVSCLSNNWSYTTNSQSVDGIRSYNFRQTDYAGNITNITGTWTRDSSFPVLTITSTTPVLNTSNTAVFSGNCQTGLTIYITGTDTTTLTCPAGTWSYTSASQTTDATRSFTFTQTNASSLATAIGGSWTRDTTAPTLTTGQMSIAGGNSMTNPYGNLSFQATDGLSKVSRFCIKIDSTTAPLTSDTCWTALSASPPAVTPASSVSVSSFPFLVSFDPGAHSVYLWVDDERGNISSLTSTSAKDTLSVTYTIPSPPVVENVIASTSDIPNNPISQGQLTVSAGGTVIVKWKATSSNFGATPISVSFSTDNSTWTSLVSNIANGVNGSCTANNAGTTIDDGNTGCYAFSAPTSSSFVVRVTAKDQANLSTFNSSSMLNTGGIKIIAGATETGLGASAKSAMLISRLLDSPDLNLSDNGSFVVHPNGRVYFSDRYRGLLEIRPDDGILNSFIKVTGTSSGDGGSTSSATFKRIYKIALDQDNNLLVWDYDRIRKINFTTNTISTIIGGGTSTVDTIANPLDLKIDPSLGLSNQWEVEQSYRAGASPFFVLPNGDIYFQSQNWQWDYLGQKFRVYKPAATNKIQTILPTGTGANQLSTANLANCTLSELAVAYNTTTSAITAVTVQAANVWGRNNGCNTSTASIYMRSFLDPTTYASRSTTTSDHPTYSAHQWPQHYVTGLDGKLYMHSRNWGIIQRFDPSNNTWTTIAGGVGNGTCADGTAATSCRMEPILLFVSSVSKVFFMDRGLLRTITAGGTISTLYGQSFGSGDGGSPTQARFGRPAQISVADDQSVLVFDEQEITMREINSTRTSITKIAGAGYAAHPVVGAAAATNGLHYDCGKPGAVYEPTTGDIYYRTTNPGDYRIVRYNRGTGNWDQVAGGGATQYYDAAADGADATNVKLGTTNWSWGCSLQIAAAGPGKIALHMMSGWSDPGINETYDNPYMKILDTTTTPMKIQPLLGKTGTGILAFNGTGGTYGVGERFCTDGTNLNNCSPPATVWDGFRGGVYDATGKRWLFNNGWQEPSVIRIVSDDSAVAYASRTIGTLGTVNAAHPIRGGFAYRRNGGQEMVYYCFDSNIYKYNFSTSTETAITLPTGMKCGAADNGNWSMYNIVYNPTADAVTFIFNMNGLYGVAEIISSGL